MTDSDLVQALVSRRVANGWTQADLARRMGVATPTVARFETECLRRRSPTLFVINRYAAAEAICSATCAACPRSEADTQPQRQRQLRDLREERIHADDPLYEPNQRRWVSPWTAVEDN